MGMASKSIGKKLEVTAIQPKVEKLMEIKSEPIDEIAIKSQIDQVAINTLPVDNKKIVSNWKIAKKLGPDYIKLLSSKILEADRRAAVYQIFERQEIKMVTKFVYRYVYKYFGLIKLEYIV